MQARKGDIAVSRDKGGTMSPDEVRIELVAMGPPPPRQLAQAAATGYAPRDIHTTTRGADRWLVIDATGLRHLDTTPWWRFLRRKLNPNVAFAVPWVELAHVALQVQQGANLVMLRLVLSPANPADFAARRPELQPLRGLTGLTPDQWALSLDLDDHIDARVRDVVFDGLRRFAGGRFTGQIENG